MNFQAPNQQPQAQGLPDAMKNGIASVSDQFANVSSGISDSMNQFSQQASAGVGASSQFLQSNTIVAKIAFLILIIIVFLFLFNLGIILIGYFTSPSDNPYLIKGVIDGNNTMTIPQDPNQQDSVLIKRSNNQSKGIEFTWSFWIYVNDLGNDNTKYQHIFNKGDSNYGRNGLATINNAPGVYLKSGTNGTCILHVVMDTVSPDDRNIVLDVNDIPLRKWVHIDIRMMNTIMDIYVNGIVAKRLLLNNVPKQNYNDVRLFQNGGFSGKLSNLRYYNYALNVFEINSIVMWGPNLTTSKKNDAVAANKGGYSYLSQKWYSR